MFLSCKIIAKSTIKTKKQNPQTESLPVICEVEIK